MWMQRIYLWIAWLHKRPFFWGPMIWNLERILASFRNALWYIGMLVFQVKMFWVLLCRNSGFRKLQKFGKYIQFHKKYHVSNIIYLKINSFYRFYWNLFFRKWLIWELFISNQLFSKFKIIFFNIFFNRNLK